MASPIRSKYGSLRVREEARERRMRARIGSMEGEIRITIFNPQDQTPSIRWQFTPVNEGDKCNEISKFNEIITPIIPTPPPFELEK